MMPYPYGLAALPGTVKLVADLQQARVSMGTAIATAALSYMNSMYAMQPPPQRFVNPQPGGSFARARSGAFGVNVTQGAPWAFAAPQVAFVEGDESFTAYVEMPNAETRDISVKVDGNQIYVYRHAPSDDLSAVLAIPAGANLDSIAADYNDGVLQVRIGKDAKRVRREVKVQTGGKGPSPRGMT